MEVARKRHGSSEVQELMNAVRSDYEFFAKFESPFRSTPPIKRQRGLSDNSVVQCAVVRPTPLYNEGLNLEEPLNERSSSENIRFNGHELLPELIRLPSNNHERSRTRGQSTKSREQHGDSSEEFRNSREQEQMFQKLTPDFWAAQANQKTVLRSPFTQRATRAKNESLPGLISRSDIVKPGEFICLSSEAFTSPGVSVIGARKRQMREIFSLKREIPDVPPLLIRADTKSFELGQSTRVSVDDFPTKEPFVDNTSTKIRRLSVEEEQEIVKRPRNNRKRKIPSKKMYNSDSEGELVIVESTSSPVSRQLSDDQSPTNHDVGDNHVISSQTNKNPKELEQGLPIERKNSDGGSSAYFTPTEQIWPDYVITRVGSLLWLDKEVVYPVTLDEMRRRVQDPENFSFQMLIAYVRHSRAKGRQFLDYWKCQPSGKTSRPNVLSKLCEADVRELVKGIHKVNEEYFPHDTLARQVAAEIFQEKGNRLTGTAEEGDEAKESLAKAKVKAIEKSRWVCGNIEIPSP